ncbi:MFS transporter [Novosphingobium sp. SG707]|uniref:MFS transporter n=1 Tax=Novosphingobium sp. SG707 TaxID=2586996 RepID=UPI0014460CE3|nr:MFS transporter [Novosphingobium sp. SG707]NKI98350.1 MFS family permease [Novosphingobium sp. SG707]
MKPWRAWSAVLILCIAQVVSTVDRGMLALVVDPVRRDLAIGEVDIALLQGFAFAVFYVSVGLPLGYVADRVNRRRLLFGGILVWSAGTIACGLAQTFAQMFLARLVIGVGEAVLGPCAVGMIGEMFAPDRRGRPMALYVLGSMVAYGLGSMAAGAVLQAGAAGGFAGWPGIADLAPWRIAFVLMGLAGLPVALLLLSIAQTRRANSAQPLSLPFADMAARRGVLLPLYGAVALFAMGAAAASGWGAALLSRAYHYTPADVGKQLGVAQLVCSLIGAGLAAVIVDRVARRGGTVAKLRMSALLALLTIPACMGFVSQSGAGALAITATVMATSAIYGTTMLSILAEAVPVEARGLAVALYAFVMTMIGGSLGPLAVATLTERVFADPARVGWSMALVGGVALSLSALLAAVAARAQEKLDAC